MLPTRTFGQLVRTKASRAEVAGAWIFGCLLGFLPGFILPTDLGGGFAQAPGLILLSIAVALVFKLHLGMFALAILLSKLASIPLLPVSHSLGQALVDGLQPAFAALRDTPLVAWCGPEHYATVGGVLLGLVTGLVSGLVAWRGLQGFRAVMAKLDDSKQFSKVAEKSWLQWLSWAALGGDKGKKTWRELHDQKQKFLPGFRWQGAVVVVLALVAGWFVQRQLAGRSFAESSKVALENLNGATVDVETAEVSLLSGLVTMKGLALADAKDLDRDVFRAEELDLALDTYALAQRRLVVDRLSAVGAVMGARRETPGELVGPPPTTPPAPDPEGEEMTVEDWIREAEVWKDRLEQTAEWIEYLAGGGEEELEEAEERRIEEEQDGFFGFAKAFNREIASRYPAVLVREVAVEKIAADWLGDGDLLDLRGSNLSSHPSRLDAPMELSLTSRSGLFRISLRREPGEQQAVVTDLVFDGLPVDGTLAAMGLTDAPVSGGTMKVSFSGRFDASGETTRVDAPLRIETQGATLALGGLSPTSLDGLPIAFGLRGPLANPRVGFDDDALKDALLAKGRTELAAALQRETNALLQKHLGPDVLKKLGGGAEQALQQALGGDVEGAAQAAADEAKKKAEEAAKAAAEEAKKKAAEELKKKAGGALKGLFPGSKKKEGSGGGGPR